MTWLRLQSFFAQLQHAALTIEVKVGNREAIFALRGPGPREVYRQLMLLEDNGATDGAFYFANGC